MWQYKGYMGQIELDDEARIFHGEVIDLRDVVTFQGRSVEELEEAFRDSVDDYLEFCELRGEEPDKPFSGRHMLRVSPQLHRQAYTCPAGRQEPESVDLRETGAGRVERRRLGGGASFEFPGTRVGCRPPAQRA